jgi:5'-nucleotidase (lipoprotein e(P4) family)
MKNLLILLSLVTLFSCSSTTKNPAAYSEQGTLWIQNAAEVRALSYQAFNSARTHLDYVLRKKRYKKRPAIVLDIDETLLDNSPYQAQLIVDKHTYEKKSWYKWIDMAQAKALPGSVDFLNYAHKRGVKIIYISNRKIRGLDKTYENMVEVGFPVKRQDIFLRTTTSSKEERRQEVMKKYDIVMLVGDTLGDFSEDFHKKSTNERNILTDKSRGEFGRKYIVLPNPMYGDWENAMYNYEYSKTNEEKAKMRRGHLYPHN